jgi:hypothetical protein
MLEPLPELVFFFTKYMACSWQIVLVSCAVAAGLLVSTVLVEVMMVAAVSARRRQLALHTVTLQ